MLKLTVHARDETTEIFVVASDFVLRGRGAHRLVTDLEPGIYKVRAVSGRNEWHRVVALREDATIEVPHIAFGSAAPLAGTTRTHETHMNAAEHALPPDPRDAAPPPPGAARTPWRAVRSGHDASFVFMARWWTPGSGTGGGTPALDDPAAGATLRTGRGRRLLTLDASGEAEGRHVASVDGGRRIASEAAWFSGDRARDRFSGVSLRAAAGLYTLGLSDGGGMTEQIVTLLPGWRTHVFALYEPVFGEGEEAGRAVAKRLVDLSIHITRDGLSMLDEVARLTDAARLALADERSNAAPDLLQHVRGKSENPMLGLYSAHLLLLLKDKTSAAASVERPVAYDGALFHEIVANAAEIFGPEHPDIVALGAAGKDGGAARGPVTVPPMIWRGWTRLLAASAGAPRLVEPPLWRRTVLRSRSRPLFAWRVPQSGGERLVHREIDLARAVLSDAAERERLDGSAAGLLQGTASAPVREKFLTECIIRFEAPRSVLEMIL